MQQSLTIVQFTPETDESAWYIVDDEVMGGRSNGRLSINDAGHGQFSGLISLENNGGFSSLRYRSNLREVSDYKKVVLRIKGDGKIYQFRVKSKTDQNFSYVSDFKTSGEWETIEIPFDNLRPAFRGNFLNKPNYPGDSMEEIGLLFGNKKEETFQLIIDSINLE